MPKQTQNLDTYIAGLLDSVYGAGSSDKAKIKAEVLSPAKVGWSDYSLDLTPEDFGTYTLNPDTKDMTEKDFEAAIKGGKIKIVNAFNDSLFRIAMKIVKEDSAEYYIPGIEFAKWLTENPAKAPAELLDGTHYYFFGTLIRRGGDNIGDWGAPYVSSKTGGAGLGSHITSIGNTVDANNQAILIKK